MGCSTDFSCHCLLSLEGKELSDLSADSHAVVRRIWEEVRACVCPWRKIHRTAANQELCLAWGVPLYVLQQAYLGSS